MRTKKCLKCKNWIKVRKTIYEDGSEIINWLSEPDVGHCAVLEIDTKPDFGCLSFEPGKHEVITHKTGEPWHHYVMIPCPDCDGRGSFIPTRHCPRCIGTGTVARHDDGYISDNHTRKHPKEKRKEVPEDQSAFTIKKPDSAKEGVV